MRILILHNLYQHLGGEDTVVQQEADELSTRGHEIKILSEKNSKGLKGLLQYGLYPFNFIVSSKLLKEIGSFNPDIVHVHNLHYGTGPLIVKRLKEKGYPVVMTLHNFRLICPSATLFYRGSLFTKSIDQNFPWTAVKEKVQENSFLKTLITAFTYWVHKKTNTWNTVDRYFTFSEFSKGIFTKSTLHVNADKFVIKPNFATITNNSNKTFSQSFVYIGRLSDEKGIIPLLQAIAKTNFKLKVFGSGPQQEEVKEFATNHSNIQYLGFQNKTILSQEISEANALIVPSVCYEGMPMTIIEAFALGTPVICSDIGILQQMVVPLYTGLHFDPHVQISIIASLEQWSNLDIQSKLSISNNCLTEFHQKYTKDKNLSLLETVYQQVIKENEHNNHRPA